MMPLLRAAKTAGRPIGMKPWELRLSKWCASTRRTSTVSTGIAIFQKTVHLFVSASQRTPSRLIPENATIRIAARTKPSGSVRVPSLLMRPCR